MFIRSVSYVSSAFAMRRYSNAHFSACPSLSPLLPPSSPNIALFLFWLFLVWWRFPSFFLSSVYPCSFSHENIKGIRHDMKAVESITRVCVRVCERVECGEATCAGYLLCTNSKSFLQHRFHELKLQTICWNKNTSLQNTSESVTYLRLYWILNFTSSFIKLLSF